MTEQPHRDGLLVRIAAESVIDQYGRHAAKVARERAAIAEGTGDLMSADAWRDIAQAIDALQAP